MARREVTIVPAGPSLSLASSASARFATTGAWPGFANSDAYAAETSPGANNKTLELHIPGSVAPRAVTTSVVVASEIESAIENTTRRCANDAHHA